MGVKVAIIIIIKSGYCYH